ncbi:MAG: PD40 domain-containing protein [SAR324 cluster bacterium]|nr:PD40 domain-containing protein [SAR324 cluster bacterium]
MKRKIALFANLLVFVGFLISRDVAFAQFVSKNEINISGVAFSRFPVTLEEDGNFAKTPQGAAWKSLVEKNLCWSGIFTVKNSQMTDCDAPDKTSERKIMLGITSPASMTFEFFGANKTSVFQKELPLFENKLNESTVIETINQLTELITGHRGILGTSIAFTLKQPERKKIIARVNTHGQNLAGFYTHPESSTILPKWAPDGKGIVYTLIQKNQSKIMYYNFSDPPMALADGNSLNHGGSWFPNGRQMVVTLSKNSNADLYMLDIGDPSLKRLTSNKSIETSPAVSPDGKSLLFVSDRTGSEQIFIKNLMSNAEFRITFDGPKNSDPAWSPDGKLIAFTRTVNKTDQIFLMDPNGENLRQLTDAPVHSEHPSWSPDGNQIVFASRLGSDFKLYIMFINGTGMRRLTSTVAGFNEESPNWNQPTD